MGMTHFLLVYDAACGVLVGHEEHASAGEAGVRYAELELDHRGDDIEIVLLGADSIETLKRTHGNYFGHGNEALAGLLPLVGHAAA